MQQYLKKEKAMVRSVQTEDFQAIAAHLASVALPPTKVDLNDHLRVRVTRGHGRKHPVIFDCITVEITLPEDIAVYNPLAQITLTRKGEDKPFRTVSSNKSSFSMGMGVVTFEVDNLPSVEEYIIGFEFPR